MGMVAKALFRNNLPNLRRAFQNLAARNQREKETESFLADMDRVQKENEAGFYDEKFYDKEPMQFKGPVPNMESPGEQFLGDKQGPMNREEITDPRRIREATNEGQRRIIDLFMKRLGDEQLNFGKVQAGGTALQQLLETRQRPETEYFNLGRYDTRFAQPEGQDPYEIARGQGEESETDDYVGPELDENGKEVTFEIGGQTYYNEQTISNGKVTKNIRKRIPKEGEGSTNVNVPPNYAKYEEDMTLGVEDYKYYQGIVDEGNTKIEKLQTEFKQLQTQREGQNKSERKKTDEKLATLRGEITEIREGVDQAQEDKEATFGGLKATADATAVVWSSKENFEGFDLEYNRIRGLVKDNPELIDDTVERELVGTHPEVIMKMKELLHTLVFDKDIAKQK